MEHRVFGRTGWEVTEIGFGAWGLSGEWGAQDDSESIAALHKYLDLGGNFIDTAQAYGSGRSERIIGQVLKERREEIFVATKLPPKNGHWAPPSWTPLEKSFPLDYIEKEVETSLTNMGIDCIDLYQLHTWCETWNTRDDLFAVLEKLKTSGKVKYTGISTTEGYPECVIPALKTGIIDSLQLIFNLFEQHPRDTLLPLCHKHHIGVIVRVPFDEASLTGKFQGDERFAKDDFRSIYFRKNNLKHTVERVEKIKEWANQNVPGMSLPELALRFVLSHEDVDVVIPGIRTPRHAELNTAPSDGIRLPEKQMKELKAFAWRRNPWDEDLAPLEPILKQS